MGRQDDWLGTEEVARLVGMSRDWVRRQVREGRLPATEWIIGGRTTLRYQRRDVEAFKRRFSRLR
jgi:excisionase family DNA binding protein